MSDHINAIVFCLDCRQVFNIGEHVVCVHNTAVSPHHPSLWEVEDETE
jgi:hypothetical protein